MVDTNTLTVYTTDDLNRVCFHNNTQKTCCTGIAAVERFDKMSAGCKIIHRRTLHKKATSKQVHGIAVQYVAIQWLFTICQHSQDTGV